MNASLDIFRPGRHTASSGTSLAFTEADLAATAAAYDPALHEAPIVVGHPKDNAPAYGWVKSLAFAEGHLHADPHQVDAAFAELVAAGRFKKISASFYTPDAPANPKPGVYYLRHVGFLGAQPPAIKGLKDASFAGSQEGVLEFGDWDDRINAGLWRGLRDWLIGKFGLEEADQVLPTWDIDQLKTLADQPDPEPALNAAYMEEQRMTTELERREAELKTKQEALARKEADFKEKSGALETKEQAARKVELLAFCETLVQEGRLRPTHKEPVAAFMAQIRAEDVLAFGEGGNPEPTLDWFKSFLGALPKQLSFQESAGGDKDGPIADFSAAPGYEARTEDLELLGRAQAYQKSNPGTDILAAVRAVKKGV